MPRVTLRFIRGAFLLGAMAIVTTAAMNTVPPAASQQLYSGSESGASNVAKTGRLVAQSDCSVTGDLVGDANPAQVYATLCHPGAEVALAETR